MDGLTIILLLAFAFISASFIARNSDLWLHLATGRMLASGEYQFGSDPFSYTTANRYWANHSWLFDLGFYKVWQWFGEQSLVALKAATVAATAAVMLLVARGTGPRWLNTICICLGVLALSPRVLLQPVIASYLLLALCLWCLKVGGRSYYALPALVVVWVNVDVWFILGPMMIGLFWLGRKLESHPKEPPGAWPVWLIPGSIAACLLNPHHFHAFALPIEVSPAVWNCEFISDPRIAGLFASSWHWRSLSATGGYSLAAWAFFVLLGLGIISFAINRSALRNWRGAVWLAFAAFAAWQARLVPFFAVVGAPICALNLGEAIRATSALRAGRAFALLSCIMLVAIGYLGRENGFYNRDHAVAWGIHTDQTLKQAAQGIAGGNADKTTYTDEKVFNSNIDLGHYMAWFAHGDRSFLDSRLQLFTHVAQDYADLSRAIGLLPEVSEDRSRGKEILLAQGITAIELYDPDPQRMTNALRQVAGSEPRQWDIVRIDGGAVFLKPAGLIAPSACFDADRLAFAPHLGEELRHAGRGPEKLVEPVASWVIEAGRGRMGSWEADAATVYLRLFEATPSRDTDRSPALPLLGVRAARVGIEKDPLDATAWLMLARAYLLLGQQTWEREAGDALTLLSRIRRIQITTALVQAVLLNPDSIPARELLVNTLQSERALDLAYQHAAEQLHAVRRAGPNAKESPEAYSERLANNAAYVARIEEMVQIAENRFMIRTAALSGNPLARAKVAVELGLAQKAIDVLVNSHFDLYGAEGLGLLIHLLLQTGQAAGARELLERQELRKNTYVLGFQTIPGKSRPDGHNWGYKLLAYDWFSLCLEASVGNYEAASEVLQRLTERLENDERSISPMLNKNLAAQLAVEAGFAVPFGSPAMRLRGGFDRSYLLDSLKQAQLFSVMRADLTTLSGILELERGNSSAALERGEAAIKLYAEKKGQIPSLPGEPLAAKYVGEIRRQRR